MPIQINSPGWKARRAGVARSGARGLVDQNLLGVPPEFLTEASEVDEEVVLEPAAASRGREVASPPPVVDVTTQIERGRTAVLAIRHPSGALTFHQPVQSTSRGLRGPNEVRFQVPVRPAPAATRGLVDSAIKAIVISVAKIAGDKAVSLLLPRLAEAVEKAVWKKLGLREGWLAVSKQGLLAGVLEPGTPVSPARSLLFLHGTFSHAAAAYKHLAASDFFDRVKDTYGDRMFAFDHFSVSRTPSENARMLLESLPAQKTTFDVVTHSRGGLVLRNLVERAEQFGDLANRFTLGRAVLVASPNEGTPLATPQRWDETIGWLANVLEMFPDNPFTTGASFVANGLVWAANHASGDLPGLHAMDGAGDPIADLQGPPSPSDKVYSALVANYHPTGDVLHRLIDLGIDHFFSSANDLVMPSESGWRIDRSSTFIPSTRIGCFGPGGNLKGDDVTHVGFFAQPATGEFLIKGLLGRPQGLAGVDPHNGLPSRRLGRGAMSDAPTARPKDGVVPSSRPSAERSARRTPKERTEDRLRITVINGDLTFETAVLLLGHYKSLRLTGTESVMNRLIGGAMERSLAMGQYPVAIGAHQIFINHVPDLERGTFMPRPKAVVVTGLGEEGKLRGPAVIQTVRQAVIAWAQRLAEDAKRPSDFELAATLLGSGGTGVTAGDAARLVALGVYEANELLRQARGNVRALPQVSHLRLIEVYLDRATEAWRALRMQAQATPERYTITEAIKQGVGSLPRPADFGYRGAEFDFISVETKADKDGVPLISYTLDTRRARSEVRGQRAQSQLLTELVTSASNDRNRDERIGRTLFGLLIPIELEAYLAGSGEMQIELDPQTAKIPWELLDTTREPQSSDDADDEPSGKTPEVPWAIRVKLLRKLRIGAFREHVTDATREASALVIGEPACPDNYPRLYGARREAIAVRDCLAGVLGRNCVHAMISDDELLRGAEAREVVTALFEKAWRIVHLSGHGVPGKGGNPGGVVLSNGTFLGPDEIGNMRTVPELVFVNCCHLGSADADQLLKTGYDRADFASGVAGALIRIGVRCVVAAGWAVDDDAAQVFAETFYRSLLDQDRFIVAVGKAREQALARNPEVNTWAAYQCYGDPDWVLRGSKSEAPAAVDFSGVASATSLKLALERLIVQTKFQGADPAMQLESVRALEARAKAQAWDTHGDVAEMIGAAFVEAGDVETGMRWYEIAVASADGKVSIKAAEQLANVRSRLAWEIVDKAVRYRDAMQARLRGLKGKELAAGRRAHAHARKALTRAVARANDLINRSLALMDRLVAVGTTMERMNVIGSAYKRRALVQSASRRGSTAASLHQMKAFYEKAQVAGIREGVDDLHYSAWNSLAADVALHAGRPRWHLDREVAARIRRTLEAKNKKDSDFWSVVGGTELDQYEAMAHKKLSESVDRLSDAYEDLHKRVAATRMWGSVYDTACLVLANYASRLQGKEQRSAERLLTQLRDYAYSGAAQP